MAVTPKGLGKAGSALWKSLGQEVDTAAGRLALEACRSADRLDELDSIIQGKGVVELMQFRRVDRIGDGTPEQPVVIEVKFDNVLGEARQQQNGLRQLLTSLANLDAAKLDTSKPAPASTPPSSSVDEFSARRKQRTGA